MKKYILCVIFVLVAVCAKAQDITVLQINAKWNERNNYDLSDLNGVIVKYSYLKDQPKDVQKSISAVPVIVIIDGNGRVRRQFIADLSFKIQETNMEIQYEINRIKRTRRASTN
jgi:hypothetical protein